MPKLPAQRGPGRPPLPKESPGLLPAAHYYKEDDFEQFLELDLRARRELTGALAGGRPLNMRKLIGRFGGPTLLHQRLIARGFRITIKAIEKWRERGRMSSDWLNELFVMAAEEGRPLLLENYIIGFPKDLKGRVQNGYRRAHRSDMGELRLEYLGSAAEQNGGDTLLD
jgi:hypothetical protein